MTVQKEPVGGVSVAPLPTSYWQTPINAMNVNNWYVLGGAWLLLTVTAPARWHVQYQLKL